jgi:signal transduction histidine kinase
MCPVQSGLEDQHRVDDAILVARRIAHMYSNVLTSILGFVEMSLAQAPVNSTLKRYLDVALRGTQQGVSLTQRLRLLGSRTSSGAQGVSLLPVIARQAGRRANPEQEIREIIDVPGDLPLVALSNEQVTAILEALLDNAYEAADNKGSVSVSATLVTLGTNDLPDLLGHAAPGIFVQLDVTDSGPGLTPEVRAHLFQDPFFTSKPRHFGLGLTIVYSILKGQQGGLRLLDAPGGGLTVRVFLPVAGRSGGNDDRSTQT